jgi:hypothetical protein
MRAATIVREQASSGLGSVRPGLIFPREIPPKPKRRRSVRSALAWGGLGFVTGAIFWHVVGFWTFLSDVVLKAPDRAAKAALLSAAAVPARPKTNLPTVYMVEPATCSALALDRQSNRTMLQPCPANGLALRVEPQGGREDMATMAQPVVQAAGYRAD